MSREVLLESCKDQSLEIFKGHSGSQEVYLADIINHSGNKQNLWSSFILLGGSKFRLMFEAQFTTITLLGLASERFSDVEEADYIDNVKDFMREYCNLFAGKLKACFEKVTDAYLSLPIISRNIDVSNLFDAATENLQKESWCFGDSKMQINISLYYYEKEIFDSYDFVKKHLGDKETDNDLEFF